MPRGKKAPELPPLEERLKPGLSETLAGPRDPRMCQRCGAVHTKANPLGRWVEHDEYDQLPRRPAVVVLCKACSDHLIDPHPRLYRFLWPLEPFPGCMSACVDCGLRDGVSCRSELSRFNGGPGLTYKFAGDQTPTQIHVNFGGGRGEWRTMYPAKVSECSGRYPREPVVEPHH